MSLLLTGAGAQGSGVTGVTLDPAFSNGAHTLSNGNLTATGTGAVGISRSTATHTTGKYYFEATLGQINNFFIGLCDSAALNSTYLSSNGDTLGVQGSVWNGSSLTGITTSPTLVNGHVYGIAFDATARLVWIKDITAASNWNANGTADPATGVNGCNFSASNSAGTATLYAATTCASSGDTVTFNFGGTAYAGTAPSGFGNM